MSVSFAPKFEKEKGTGGKQLYTFHVQHAVLEEEGALLTPADIQRGGTDLQHLVWNIPEGVKAHTEEIMRVWLQQCRSVFTTPPPLEKCLANTIVLIDNTVKIPTIDSEEEDLINISNILSQTKGLSFEDCSVWYFAKLHDGILLTGGVVEFKLIDCVELSFGVLALANLAGNVSNSTVIFLTAPPLGKRLFFSNILLTNILATVLLTLLAAVIVK